MTGTVRSVRAGGNLQAALNAAKCEDAVEIEAGASFTGNFILSPKGCSPGKGVWIRSSTWGSKLPPKGTRVAPSNAGVLAKIVSPNASPALRFDFGASAYYLTGLEITHANATTGTTNYGLVAIGTDANDNFATARAQLPDRVIFDRCYIHGTRTGNTRRGISANGAGFALVDSYVSEIHEVGADSQAVGSWNGSGPFKIVNNYLEGAGEVVMFGGSDASVPDLVPSDAEIRGNTLAWQKNWNPKDPSYDGSRWSLKNLFELKNAERVLVDGNTFDTWWPAGQIFAIVLTVRNQNGTNPWAIVADVTFTNNRLTNIRGSGINLLGHDSPGSGGGSSQQMARVLIANNLFESIADSAFQVLCGPVDLAIRHNTVVMTENNGTFLGFDGSPKAQGFIYQDNVVGAGKYMVCGTNAGCGDTALNAFAPGALFDGNAIYGPYPTSGDATPTVLDGHPGNYFPANRAAVLNPDFGVTAAYKGKATDGSDPGVDLAKLPQR